MPQDSGLQEFQKSAGGYRCDSWRRSRVSARSVCDVKQPKNIILCEVDPVRIAFVKEHYPEVLVVNPAECDIETFVKEQSEHCGADRVLEVAEVLRPLNWHGKWQDQMPL